MSPYAARAVMSHAAIARRIASISLAAASGFASAAAGVDAHRSTTRSADARRSTSRPTTTTSTARPVSASLAHSLACCAPQRADRAFCLVLRSPATAPPGVRSRSRATAAGLTGAVPGATMHSRVDPRHARSTGARRPACRPHHARYRSTNRVVRVANLVGAEAVLKLRVLRSQPRLRCVLGLPRRGSTSGTTAETRKAQ